MASDASTGAALGSRSSSIRLRRIEAVVNAASGSVGPDGAEALEATLAEFGFAFRIANAEPRDIEAAVRKAVAASPDLVVVLAGDGTARLAAELCGPEGPLVAPLPGGTMNMLPHALYGQVDWREALQSALHGGVARSISGGRVGGRSFYVAAMLGAPALWASAREAVRERRLRIAWLRARRALARAFSGGLHFQLDGGERRESEALTLICPLVSKVMREETALEATVLDLHGAAEAFRLGLHILLGRWRDDPAVTVELCRSGRAWARGRIPASLDGEPHRLERSAEIEFEPRAFRALAPPRETVRAQAKQQGERAGEEAAKSAATAEAAKTL